MSPTLNELKLYIPTAKAFENEIPTFAAKFRMAERECMNKWISKEVYESLLAGTNDDIKDIIKNCLYNYAFFEYIPYAPLRASNTGLLKTENDKEKSAKPEEIENLRVQCFKTAMAELENIFEYLEETQPTIWTSSTKYSIFNEYLIKTASDFQKYCNINNSRRVFLSMKHGIDYAETIIVEKVLGKELLDSLRSNPTGDKKILLEKYVKPAIANYAFANSILDLNVVLGEYDTVLQFDNTGANNQKGYKQADTKNLIAIIDLKTAQAKEFLDNAIEFIQDNTNSFPEYQTTTGSNSMPSVVSETAAIL